MVDFNWEQPLIIVGCLIEKDGKFLLVKEAGGPSKGKWNIPAGKLEMHETLVQGAARETLEESGYQVKIENLLGVYRPAWKRASYIFILRA